ncbi:MAG: ABC transporter substrate binding protein [Candidatus Binatia bacterium]
MGKILIHLTLGVLLFALSFSAEGQQPGKISRIGILNPGRRNDAGMEALSEAFRQGLKDLGYVEGKNVVLEYRFAEAEPDRLREIAAEFVRLKVDVIFTINTPASRAAKSVTQTIPIVFTWVADPLAGC